MPAERVSMRQAREIIRLKFSTSLPTREIARRLGLAPSTVRETLGRLDSAGLSWPLPEGIGDAELEAALYANRRSKRGHRRHAEPDWPTVHRELKRKHVTLLIVWDEYIAANPGGYSYSRFCELYRGFEAKLSPTMRQTHAAGERLFVDYAGDGVPVVVDRLTGEVRMAQIFVAVLGASSFTFAHASWTQALPDWIDAHVRALEAIGGVPQLLVPDNTKTAVIKACLYDPQVNRTYAEMAAHYEAAILPARPRRPRDKAKVEQAVLIVERWLLGRLRHRTFYSLSDVNAAIADLMTHLNEQRPIRRLGATRRQLLETVDRPSLRSLPAEPYEFSEWRTCRVGIDYHVEVAAHYYSVPHRFARTEVDARLTARTVEIFLKGERIAVHVRASGNHKHTTVSEHMPSSHRRYAGWTIERIRADARLIGPATAALCELILETRPHPEQGFRACLGIVRLAGPHGAERLEAARRTRHRHRRPDLRLDQIHPRQQPRPASRAPALHGRNADPARQHPWAALLQLGETTCSNIPPSINSTPLACMAWPRPSSKSPPMAKPTGSAITNGSGFCSIARRRGGRTSASRRGCAPPNCASRRASRMSITEAPAVLTARCSKSWSRASGSMPTTIWFSSVRQASAKVGWPQRLATKPVATIGRSSISGRPVCSRISRLPAATGAIPASYATSAEPTFSSSMIGGLSHSTPSRGMISWKSLKSAMDAAPR